MGVWHQVAECRPRPGPFGDRSIGGARPAGARDLLAASGTRPRPDDGPLPAPRCARTRVGRDPGAVSAPPTGRALARPNHCSQGWGCVAINSTVLQRAATPSGGSALRLPPPPRTASPAAQGSAEKPRPVLPTPCAPRCPRAPRGAVRVAGHAAAGARPAPS